MRPLVGCQSHQGDTDGAYWKQAQSLPARAGSTPTCAMWQRDSPHCPVGQKRLEPRNCSGLDTRPWQLEITTLARKSHANGPILLLQPRGQHTAAPSFTARREDESERGGGGGHLDWTNLKEQFFFTRERESSWTSN